MSYDPSAAQTRTTLAWRRTALALAVLATFSIKFTFTSHKVIGVLVSITALIGAGLLYIYQYRSDKNPLPFLLLCSIVIALLGCSIIVQII